MKETRPELLSVVDDPHSIKSIPRPTDDEMKLALDLDPTTFQYFADKASDEVRMQALRRDPTLVQYMDHVTDDEAICILFQSRDVYREYRVGALAPKDEEGAHSLRLQLALLANLILKGVTLKELLTGIPDRSHPR